MGSCGICTGLSKNQGLNIDLKYWVSAKEVKLSYYHPETILFTMYP